jgi:hypothetical protein
VRSSKAYTTFAADKIILKLKLALALALQHRAVPSFALILLYLCRKYLSNIMHCTQTDGKNSGRLKPLADNEKMMLMKAGLFIRKF